MPRPVRWLPPPGWQGLRIRDWGYVSKPGEVRGDSIEHEQGCVPDVMKAVGNADCVVVVTNHSTYDYQAIYDRARLIVDTRNALGKIDCDITKVETL